MLSTRLWMGALLIAGLAGGLWLDERWDRQLPRGIPPYPCWLVLALAVVLICSKELVQLLGRRGIRLSRLIYPCLVGITLSNWLPFLGASPHKLDHLTWALAAVCACNMVLFIREAYVFREAGTAVTNVGGGVLATFYLGALAAFLIELRWANAGLVALASHVAAAKCGDIGAYFGGRAMGRRKLCPWLSPNKTVEGAIAGLISSVLGTLAVVLVGAWLTGEPPALTVPAASVFGLSVGVLAMVGDLAESLIKRDCQQKDASDLVPGFGGGLDVMDSLLFSAPLAFALWHWLGP